MVQAVNPGTAAALAGIRAASGQVLYGRRPYPIGGDILIAFEGQPITSAPELLAQIDHFKAKDKVTFTIVRGSQKMEVPIVLQEMPRNVR